MKIIAQQELKEVSNTAVEVLGYVIEDGYGRKYVYKKNSATTDCVAGKPCLRKGMGALATGIQTAVGNYPTTSVLDSARYIKSYDDAGETFSAGRLAGIPVTTIGASGSATGDYGYVLAEGIYDKYAYVIGTASVPVLAGNRMVASSAGAFVNYQLATPATLLIDETGPCVYLLQPTTNAGGGNDANTVPGVRMVRVSGCV